MIQVEDKEAVAQFREKCIATEEAEGKPILPHHHNSSFGYEKFKFGLERRSNFWSELRRRRAAAAAYVGGVFFRSGSAAAGSGEGKTAAGSDVTMVLKEDIEVL